MNRTEHLLICLAEECAEVAQRVSKALRFGLGEVQPGQDFTNAERVNQELHDLVAVAELLIAAGAIKGMYDRAAIEAKKQKVAAYTSYSEHLGTVAQPSSGDARAPARRDGG